MQPRKFLPVALIALFILSLGWGSVAAQDNSPDTPAATLGSGFTYQGSLENSGNPITAVCDIRFGLWNALTGGTQVGSLSTIASVQVTDGLFTVSVNVGGEFGTSAFTGQARWLAIETRCPAATGTYTLLSPRQEITLVPYAAHADLLDGQHGSYYQSASNINAGTLGTGYYSAYGDLTAEGYLGNATGDLALNNNTLQSTLNADLLDGQHGASYKVGRPVFSLTQLDSAGDVGKNTSITIGTDGLGLISYYDNTNHDLKVAHCSNIACTSATAYTLDSTGDVGSTPSITIGPDGLGLISYFDNTNYDLKVAHCSNTACSSATTYTLDSTGTVGVYSSITIGADGLGLISYTDFTNAEDCDLKVAHCADTACSSAAAYTLDNTGNVGYFTSITIGTDGLGLISYYDYNGQNLKVAHCSNAACSFASIQTLDSGGDVGLSPSITIGTDGLGLIAYYDLTNHELKVAHCVDTACSSANIIFLYVSGGDNDVSTSITTGTDGLGLISYRDWTNFDLKVAHCIDTACSSVTAYTLDSGGDVGKYTSITIGADGMGLISYYDNTNGDLKVAHCSNRLCMPYFRQR